MATSPLKALRFRLVFATCWWLWAIMHVLVLNWYGYSWKLAIWDSAISNVLLAGMSVMITTILQFYIPKKNKYGYILALCLVLAGLWLLISKSMLLLITNENADYTYFFTRSVPIRYAFGFLTIGCMALISVLWYTIQDQYRTETRQAEAEKLSKEAELYKLRQQLQPHFLFNSLNSINALIGIRPQQARTMIQQLSDFLRGTLKKEDNQWLSITEELQHLQLYLEIEKVRFGHRLSTEIKNEASTATIPAMLLQPIVENAIKFGLYDTMEPITITLSALIREGYLEIQVTNPFDPATSSPKKGTGFGLSSVQRRLYLLFARNDLIQTSAEDNTFITAIKIPQYR
ncbi:MAG TPA: histidine kinase [Flavisolibacter sp.]|nr:histidine kinase [Flavisolibacter sp.]